jgi:hypothetical protein
VGRGAMTRTDEAWGAVNGGAAPLRVPRLALVDAEGRERHLRHLGR